MEKLTQQIILDTTEKMIYQNGIKNTTLYDIAKNLNVSHAALYKHFSNKDDLFEQLTKQWLANASEDLLNWNPSAKQDNQTNLHDWLWLLANTKKDLYQTDRQMFLLYTEYIESHQEILSNHLAQLSKKAAQVGKLDLKDGEGLITAFTYFHNPYFADHWSYSNYQTLFEQTWNLIKDF